MGKKNTVAFLAALFFAASHAAAGLTWPTTKIEGTSKLGEDYFSATFSFTNHGDKPVSILSVSTSCGCTTATAEKKIYAPGETGEIKARLDVRGRQGVQERTILVTTDDAPQSPTVLTLHVQVPELAEVTPRLLVWSRNSPSTPKEVTVTAGTNVEITLREVSSSDTFSVEQFVDACGSKYHLRIVPRSTASPLRSEIRLKIEAVVGHPEERVIYAMVQ